MLSPSDSGNDQCALDPHWWAEGRLPLGCAPLRPCTGSGGVQVSGDGVDSCRYLVPGSMELSESRLHKHGDRLLV